MTYVVTVETCIPDGAPELDDLGQVGAAVLLERGFGSVAGAEGPDGVEVDVFDMAVGAHPGGAVLTVSVAAPTLEAAEEAVGAVTQEVLDRAEQLAGWLVVSSEVRLHAERARESLAAADGPDAPPSDPALRRARHTARPGTAGAPGTPGVPGAGNAGDGWIPDDDIVEENPDPEAELRAMAPRLRAFDPAVFAAAPETAALAAGALVHAAEVLIDELYDDVQALAEEDTDVAACQGHLWHLDRLPARHAARYDELFARRFLVTAVALTTRFTDGSFRRLGCPAEEWVARLLLEQARIALDLYGLLDEAVTAALERFAERVDEDRAHRQAGGFGSWFTPFGTDRYVHPYAVDAYPDGGPGPDADPGPDPGPDGRAGGRSEECSEETEGA
ncbi:hypothetical protein [Streptomyces sp. NPDC004267]|uniref:hypothetical protein n=1 Tax=Streptomyces sp. NPDC004267 TaxID=3364694 RepID=UPI0036AC6D58